MKKLYFLIVTLILLSVSSLVMAEEKIEKEVSITLLKKYEDAESMGSAAIEKRAKLIKKEDKYYLRIKLKAIENNGFKGYLGELKILDKEVNVVSEYDIIDDFNNPKTGTDKLVKGKNYPKEIEFEIEPKNQIIEASVYVPVMASLGFGNQDVRIKISGIDSLSFENKESEEKADIKVSNIETSKLNLENGLYKVKVKLMHSLEDKESMGNKGLEDIAELKVNDGEAYLYIKTKKIEVQNIVASISELYYLQGDKYHLAKGGDFSISIEGETEKRPSIFKIPLLEKREYEKLMIDPRVEIMGDEPIKARLKIYWDSLEKTPKEEDLYVNKFSNGEKKVSFEKGIARKISRLVKLQYEKGAFEKDFLFYANKITDRSTDELKKIIEGKNLINFYSIEFLGKLEEISEDEKIKENREKITPKKSTEIFIPIENEENNVEIYKIKDGGLEKVDYEIVDAYYKFKFVDGIIAITKGNKSIANLTNLKKPPHKNIKKINSGNRKSIVEKSGKDKSTNNIISKEKIENTSVKNTQDCKEDRNLKRENKVIIFSIIVTIIFANTISIIVINKNIPKIVEEIIENKKLKGLKKNEKNSFNN